MLLLRPFMVFIAMILFYIPPLQFIGIALLFFIYHVLIKNRNEHIKKMKEVYKVNNWKFPLEKEGNPFLWLFVYIGSLIVLFYFSTEVTNEVMALSLEELSLYNIEKWKSFLIIFSFFTMWVSYTFMINRIIKDQWKLQESELNHNIVNNRIIILREGGIVMLFRVLTLNFYEWFVLFSLLRETALHYFEDGTATGNYENLISDKIKIKDVAKKESHETDIQENSVENIYERIKKDISFLNDNEKYSKIFYEVTSLSNEKAKELLYLLFKDNWISKEEYDKINNFI